MKKTVSVLLCLSLMLGMCACGAQTQTAGSGETDVSAETAPAQTVTETEEETKTVLSEEDLIITDTYENAADGEHALTADGEDVSYSGIAVYKTGDSSGDEADFYGENAAVFATNGATLDLSGILVKTDGTHANGVFSYGEGTTVNISDSVILTDGNCSGGIMTTGNGTTNASNLTIHTTGNSSAAIRSDRGGGTVTVTGGSYTTDGKGSPVIYSTAEITVSDAVLTSTSSQGIVVEGQNSVTLTNVTLTADNNSKNSDKSEWYQAVMIYQSMSGDADDGVASFTMNGGSLTNFNGDIFFVNNTVATIGLSGAEIVNESDGVLLLAAAAGWGKEGSNGGHVTLTADDQILEGDILVDSVSTLNLYLVNSSEFTGAINPDGAEGDVYVEIEEGGKWTLTGDSHITSLTCGADAVDLNGYSLYVDGTEYVENTVSVGEEIEVPASSAGGDHSGENGPSGQPPEKPGSEGGPQDGGTPPEKPGSGKP